jgi:hypothetical protein
MDISELRRERDAYRKRQQEVEQAKLDAVTKGLNAEIKQLDKELVELAELCFIMVQLLIPLCRHNKRFIPLVWSFAILTKGSLMMTEEGQQYVA